MNGVRPKQLARMGEFYLEEAVLDVLLNAAQRNESIGAAEISKRAGIFRDGGGGGEAMASMNDAIVTGLLTKLQKADRVERCTQANGKGGWKISESEIARRQD